MGMGKHRVIGVIALGIAGTALLATPAVGPAGLVAQYRFDSAASPGADTGNVAPAADGSFVGTAGHLPGASNTPGGASSGAMATGAATTNGGDYLNAGDATKAENLSSLTITLWVNLREAPANADRLLSKLVTGANRSGLDLLYVNSGSDQHQLHFANFSNDIDGVDDSGLHTKSTNSFLSTAQGWQFVAVTYDPTETDSGNRPNGTVRFFNGTETVVVALKRTTAALGAYYGSAAAQGDTSNTAPLAIGALPAVTTSSRSPNAWFDDVRIYDETLDASAIEAIRLQNLPEPASLGLIGLAVGGLMRRRRR